MTLNILIRDIGFMLAPFQGADLNPTLVPGGVAALNHRLIVETPMGFGVQESS